MIRILQAPSPQELRQIMREIQVDTYGIDIMLPKARHCLLRVNSISNIAANILKQEMLSLGGDVAIARGALTGTVKSTDCLVMGNYSQINRLKYKLKKQPFGLAKLSSELESTLKNYQKNKKVLTLSSRKLNLASHTYIMGILNITPDSFSGDGLYQPSAISFQLSALERAQKMVNDGADIIDVGGESTRPGAKPVSIKEELSRVKPVVKLLSKKIKVPISVDTYKSEVARQALDNGASIINDITGLRDPKMARVIAKYKAGVVMMHMKGVPRNMQNSPKYESLIDEIAEFLKSAIAKAEHAGINKNSIVIDPGIGFGKSFADNLDIINRLQDFKALGKPILLGPSRKSFLGRILNTSAQDRVSGSIASCLLAAKNGADIVRVHDVSEVKQALKVFDSLN